MKLRRFNETLDCVERIRTADTTDDILQELKNEFVQYGYESFIISGLPHHDISVAPFVLLNGWPKDWFKRYVQLGYVNKDPVARHCFATADPFLWSEITFRTSFDAHAERVMNEAREFGLHGGLCIPIYLQNGMQGCLSLIGERKNVPAEERLMLQMLAFFAHGRIRQLKNTVTEKHYIELTPREREVIQWTIHGKTTKDIAEILGISARTVEFHFKMASEKLRTVNKVQTVLEAIKTKQVHF